MPAQRKVSEMFLNQSNIQAKGYDQRLNQSSDSNQSALRNSGNLGGPETVKPDILAQFEEMDQNLRALNMSVVALSDRIAPICEGGSAALNMPPDGPAEVSRSSAMAEALADFNRRIRSIDQMVTASLRSLAL